MPSFHAFSMRRQPSLLEHLIVRRRRLVKVEPFDEPTGILSAVIALHTGVLPVDRQRPFVADVIQGANDRLPVEPTVAGGTEVPAAPWVARRQVRVQHSG